MIIKTVAGFRAIASREADSKPLPGNNSRYKPLKPVIGVGGRPTQRGRSSIIATIANPRVLVDTNVVVYCFDLDDKAHPVER